MSEMSTTSAKRPLEPAVSLEFAEDEADASPTSDEPRKKGGKPGRKPLDNDAKSKRTAQNRAAQRAFRERKEKKMKELDDKVRTLEELNQQSLLETEFLRSQLVTLVNELKRYRPESQTDSQVLEYLAKTESGKVGDVSQSKQDPNSKEVQESIRRKMSFTFAFPWKNEPNDNGNGNKSSGDRGSFSSNREQQQHQQRNGNDGLMLQFPSPGSSSKSSSLSTASLKQKNGLSTPSGGDGFNKGNHNRHNNSHANGSFSSSNGFTPGSTSTGWMDNVFYNDDAQQLPQFYNTDSNNDNNRLLEDNTTMPGGYDSVTFSNQFNFNDKFDEQVSEFCSKLGQVCGTKDCPIPRKQTNSYASPAVAKSPVVFSNTWGSPSEDSQQQQPSFGDNLSNPPVTRPTNTYVGGENSMDLNSPQYKNSELPFIDTSLAFPEEQELFRNSQPDNLFAEFIEEDPQKDASNNGDGDSTGHDQDSFLASGLVQEEPSTITPKPLGELNVDATTTLSNNNIYNNDNNNNRNDNNPNNNDNSTDNDGNVENNEKSMRGFQEKNTENAPKGDTVVPSSDGRLLKCSEVWDRITSHPKYSDIDIDGLCQELMAKAKCSEKGVVVQAEDVQRALDNRVE